MYGPLFSHNMLGVHRWKQWGPFMCPQCQEWTICFGAFLVNIIKYINDIERFLNVFVCCTQNCCKSCSAECIQRTELCTVIWINMLIFWTSSVSSSCVSLPQFGPTLLSIMKHSCVICRCVQSTVQVKQQLISAEGLCLAL